MKAREANLVCWDFEGCGKWPLQVAVASMKALEIKPDFFSNLYAPPDLEIPAMSPASRLDVRALSHAPRLPELWHQLHAFFQGGSFVSHNFGSERKYLSALALHLPPQWIDTLKVIRYLYASLPNYQLGNLLQNFDLYSEAKRLALQHSSGAAEEHNPIFDACGSLLLLRMVLQQKGWEDVTVEDLSKVRPREYYQRRPRPFQHRQRQLF